MLASVDAMHLVGASPSVYRYYWGYQARNLKLYWGYSAISTATASVVTEVWPDIRSTGAFARFALSRPTGPLKHSGHRHAVLLAERTGDVGTITTDRLRPNWLWAADY